MFAFLRRLFGRKSKPAPVAGVDIHTSVTRLKWERERTKNAERLAALDRGPTAGMLVSGRPDRSMPLRSIQWDTEDDPLIGVSPFMIGVPEPSLTTETARAFESGGGGDFGEAGAGDSWGDSSCGSDSGSCDTSSSD